MDPFDLNTLLVQYGFPNPDYFNFDDGSLTYGNMAAKTIRLESLAEPSREPRRTRRR